jgi:hypothetical protein
MMHPDDDQLLRFALEVSADEAERRDVSEHIAACAGCRDRLESIHEDIRIISGIRPRTLPLTMPRHNPRPKIVYRMLRVAAVFALGALAGYGASSLVHNEPVYVSRAYVPLPAGPNSTCGFAAADATQIPARYYHDLVTGRQ